MYKLQVFSPKRFDPSNEDGVWRDIGIFCDRKSAEKALNIGIGGFTKRIVDVYADLETKREEFNANDLEDVLKVGEYCKPQKGNMAIVGRRWDGVQIEYDDGDVKFGVFCDEFKSHVLNKKRCLDVILSYIAYNSQTK